MQYSMQELQRMMDSAGNLNLSRRRIASLPDGLTVKGDLYLDNTGIKVLPERLTVGGDLSLVNNPIQSLPKDLNVGGSIDLTGTNIAVLPDGLTVNGDLCIYDTDIMVLPDNLTVKGNLYLNFATTRCLPKGVGTRKHLDSYYKRRIEIPLDLKSVVPYRESDVKIPVGMNISGEIYIPLRKESIPDADDYRWLEIWNTP